MHGFFAAAEKGLNQVGLANNRTRFARSPAEASERADVARFSQRVTQRIAASGKKGIMGVLITEAAMEKFVRAGMPGKLFHACLGTQIVYHGHSPSASSDPSTACGTTISTRGTAR